MHALFRSVALAGLLASLTACATPAKPFHPESVTVWFSPDGGCTDAIVKGLRDAKKSVRIQAFLFNSDPITDAIVAAHRRGVDVQVVLDKSQQSERPSDAERLRRAGVPVRIDAQHATAHNKIILIDDALVFTGSFNYTRSAEEKNAENLLLIRDPELAARYLENWTLHHDHADKL